MKAMLKHGAFPLLLLLCFLAGGCTTAGAALTRVASGAGALLRGVTGTTENRDALRAYYDAHHVEVESVREYAREHWASVPDKYKPSLLAIDQQLTACQANTATSGQSDSTTAQRVLKALEKAVAFYRELRTSGVL